MAVLALTLAAATAVRAQDPADAAWARGDQTTAKQLYAERVARDSTDVQAVYRLALLLAWDRHYDEGIALFDHLLRVAPDRNDARLDRARVLSWSRRFDAAIAAYAELLQRTPDNRAALLGLAQVLSWSGRYDSSLVVYSALQRTDPADLEPQRGRARVTSWQGRLGEAEALWREVLSRDSTDVAALAGLSAVLRWQGRPDAADEALSRVPPDQRGGELYPEERPWVDAALAPNGAPSLTYETDSDDNHITTLALRGRYPMRPRLQVGGDLYLRRATYRPAVPDVRNAWGLMGIGRRLFEPGWTLTAGLGLAGADGAASPTMPVVLVTGSSPVREKLSGTASLQHRPFDATALTIERGVKMTDLAVFGRYDPEPRWSFTGGLSLASLRGTGDNWRTSANAAATRTLTPRWTAAGTALIFSYAHDLDDGYFDPSFYLLSEAVARYRMIRGAWEGAIEGGPGLQVISGRGTQFTARAGARGSWQPKPGRLLGCSILYTNAGLQPFASGAKGYHYLALSVSGAWAF